MALINTKRFIVILFTTTAVIVGINSYFIIHNGLENRLPPILSKSNLDEKVWDIYKQGGVSCHGRTDNFCAEKQSEEFINVYTIGDSHFSSIMPQLIAELKGQFNHLSMNFPGCPFVLNVNQHMENGNLGEDCGHAYQDFRFAQISKEPSIILLGGRYQVFLSSMYFDNKEGGIEGQEWRSFQSIRGASFEQEFVATVNKLISLGHHIVMIYPIPEVGINVPSYIFDLMSETKKMNDLSQIKRLLESKPLTTSYKVYKDRSQRTFDLFDSVVSDRIYRVYPHTVFCDTTIKDRCITHDTSDVYYADDDHPSSTGSEMIIELIMKEIRAAEKEMQTHR